MRNKRLVAIIALIIAVCMMASVVVPLIISIVSAADTDMPLSWNAADVYELIYGTEEDILDSYLDEEIKAILETARSAQETAASQPSQPMPESTIEDEIESKELEAEQKQYEKDSIQKRIDDIAEGINGIQSEIDELDYEIEQVYDDIKRIDGEINNIGVRLEIRRGELEIAREAAQKQYEVFKERLRIMYEQGVMSYLDVIFSSDSLAEMMERYDIIMEIVEYDKNMLDSLDAAVTAVEQAQADLQAAQQEMEVAKQKAYANVAVLENKVASRDEKIATLSAAQDELVKVYEEVEAQERAIQDEIRALHQKKDEEEKRKAEQAAEEARQREEAQRAEQARQEAERAAQSSQSSTQNTTQEITSVKEYVSDKFIWPVPNYSTISSSYGMRYHPILKRNSLHSGIDIPAQYGVSAVAAADGTVIKAEYNSAYGNYIILEHNDTQTLYGHASKLLVSAGDYVNAGDVILQIGSTGYSTGPHLHFEVIIGGEAVNPMIYFD